MEKRAAQAIDKMVNPPLQGPTRLSAVNALPGGFNAVDNSDSQIAAMATLERERYITRALRMGGTVDPDVLYAEDNRQIATLLTKDTRAALDADMIPPSPRASMRRRRSKTRIRWCAPRKEPSTRRMSRA